MLSVEGLLLPLLQIWSKPRAAQHINSERSTFEFAFRGFVLKCLPNRMSLMLNEGQVKEFFERLRREHANAGERPSVNFTLIDGKEIQSGADLAPELLRDFSDHFAIPIESLRKCSFEEIELLMLQAFNSASPKEIPSLLHMPFEFEYNSNKGCTDN